MTEDEAIFTVTPTMQEAIDKAMRTEKEKIIAAFFDAWEKEGDPRRAGSIIAHIHITQAALVAVFGAECSGNAPDRTLWLLACNNAFDAATAGVKQACEEAAGTSPLPTRPSPA